MKSTSLKLAAAAFALTLLASVPAAADAVLHWEEYGMLQVNTHKCLDVHAPTMRQDGGRVQVWRCNRAPQQIWRWTDYTIRNEGGLCLDAHAPDMGTDGGRVQVWTCNGSRQQRWSYDPTFKAIKNAAGLCLDAHGPDSSKDGGRVQVWTCGAPNQFTPNQRWQVISPAPPKAGEVRTGVGHCLDAHAPDMGTNGGRVQVWQCNAAPQQTWTLDPATRTLRIASGLCLDAHSQTSATNGGRVQVWACTDERNQQWLPYPDGSLRVQSSGLCLDAHAPEQATNGGRIQVWQCNGSQQQRFVWGPVQIVR